jgi:hypothetical protein
MSFLRLPDPALFQLPLALAVQNRQDASLPGLSASVFGQLRVTLIA